MKNTFEFPANLQVFIKLLIYFSFIILFSSTSFSQLEINNVEAKLKIVDKLKIVEITYDLSGNENPDGCVINIEGKLNDGKKDYDIMIIDTVKELEGDFGIVKGNGSKKITWHAELSILNYPGPNTFKCKIRLSSTTKEPTGASLKINKLKTNAFEVHGDVMIKDLNKTGAFTSSCPNGKGDWYKTTVDNTATFYMSNNVQGFPWYIGNPQYAGSPTGQGCTSFIATKDLGTKQEQIWVCFSNEHNRKAKDVNVWSEWELQIRCYRKIKDDGSGTVEYAVLGFINRSNVWSAEDYFEDYKLDVAFKTNSVEAYSNEFEISVIRKSWYYFDPITGKTILHFHVEDLKEDTGWKGSGTNKIRCENVLISVNEYMYFDGKYIEIDTTVGLASLVCDGRFYIKDVPELFSDKKYDLEIWKGPLSLKLGSTLVASTLAGTGFLLSGMYLCSFAVIPQNLTFIGGAGTKAIGVKLDVDIMVDGLDQSCGSTTELDILTLTGFRILGLQITNEGWGFDGINIQNIGFQKDPMKVIPKVPGGKTEGGICLKDLLINVNRPEETIELGGSIKFSPFIDEAALGFKLRKGELDAFRIKFKLEPDYGIPIGIPYPPPAHLFAFLGGELDIKGIKKPPLDIKGSVYVGQNGQMLAGPLKKLGRAFEITGSIHLNFNSPMLIELIGQINLLKIVDTWIGQGEVSCAYRPYENFSLKGGIKLIDFGSGSWLADGSATGTFSWSPPENYIGLQLKGMIQVPELFKNNTFFRDINIALKLPWKLSDSWLDVKNLEASAQLDLNFPYHLGIWSLYANFNYPSGDPRLLSLSQGSAKHLLKTMYIDNTPVLSLYPKLDEEKGVPIINTNQKNSDIISQLKESCASVPADATMDRLFIKVFGYSELPSSYIQSPGGNQFFNTKSDSTIIKFVGDGENSNAALWMIINPTPGEWKVCIQNPKETDSIYAFSLEKQSPPFVLNTKSEGREIVFEWESNASSDSSTVDLFIDNDNKNYDGLYIGSVKEKIGKFRYSLTDSLSNCSYYAYGVRWDNGFSSKSYSSKIHQNTKNSLLPPSNVSAISDINGNTKICWNSSIDPNTTGNSILVKDEFGNDSLYASVNSRDTCIEIQIVNHETKKIFIVSFDKYAHSGCWSQAVDITTGLEYDETASFDASSPGIAIIPNPATAEATIKINLPRASNIELALYDLLGNKLGRLAGGNYEAGLLKTTINADEFTNGTYFIRLQTDSEVITAKLIIIK